LESALTLSETVQGPLGVEDRRLCLGFACQVLERAMSRAPLTAAKLDVLAAQLRRLERLDLRAEVDVLRCLGIEQYEELQSALGQKPKRSGSWASPFESLKRIYLTHKLCSSRDLLDILSELEEAANAMQPPMAPRLRALAETESSRTSASRGALALFLSRNWSGSIREDASITGRLTVSKVAMAIERWRLDHAGHPPEALAELAPRYLPHPPLDPFDGRELRYRRMRHGYFVYCVGPDGQDQAGRRTPSTHDSPSAHDLTFMVER
jgi:hypothetical protein